MIGWDFSNPKEDLALQCSTQCLSSTSGESERVYVGIRKISDSEAKCACIPRTNKLWGMVDGTNADGSTETGYDAYNDINIDMKSVGAYVYSIFAK